MDATVRVRTMAWFATAIVLSILATLLVSQAWTADAASGDTDSTFVPTSPCRLFDYRAAPDTVGPRGTPLGAGETHVQQVTGSDGDCTGPLAIPADAVAVAMNVTAVYPTAQSNLRVFPADVADVPTVSNLNFSAGQKPVPNKVDVKLSPDGKIKLFNANGSVSVVGDVVGYYTSSSLKEIASRLDILEAAEPFTVTAEASGPTDLTSAPTDYVSVEVTAPDAGQVTLNSYAAVGHNGVDGSDVLCKILESTEADGNYAPTDDYVQWFEKEGVTNDGTLNGTRTFTLAAGETKTYGLRCRESGDGGSIRSRILTAIFTPAP
jgi:hypothetical protein